MVDPRKAAQNQSQVRAQQQPYAGQASYDQRPASSGPSDPRGSQRHGQQQNNPQQQISTTLPSGGGSQQQQQQPRQSQRRPVQSRPSGPPKRNKQFQVPEDDCFHPRYELSYAMPYVPVGPKLFQYRLDTDQAASKYEYSCVELNKPHQILVDYNMGMRIDLVDKEKYQVQPRQQKSMLLGKLQGSADASVKVKNEDEVTDEMLSKLKQKLLSSRDKFILSNQDTLPELEPKKETVPLLKQQSSMLSEAFGVGEKGVAASKETAKQAPVFTSQGEKRDLAVKQINETFEASRNIQVGAQKLDQRGRPIRGVTAVSVKDVLPMQHAELLRLSLVVNDDDLDKATMDAGLVNNGHLLHSIKDKSGDPRQSFYSLQATESMPDEVKAFTVGKKRTATEAGFSTSDLDACNKAIQVHHIRDYAFNEIKGGSKGETADYLLYDTGNGSSIQFVPIVSKLKLNKKRKASAVPGFDEVGVAQPNRPDVSHIVMASRAYSKDEEKQMNDQLAKLGNTHCKVGQALATFTSKEDVMQADKRAADMLKEIFRPHLPKPELPSEEEEDLPMKGESGEQEGDAEENDGLFGVKDDDEAPVTKAVKRESVKEEAKVQVSEEDEDSEASENIF